MSAPEPGRKLTILLFGATGAAGSAVLEACLAAPVVAEVRAIVRKRTGVVHDKLRETVHGDYLDYGAIEASFDGVDACFFCLGVSVSQVDGEAAYRRITRDFALAAATLLKARSPAAAFQFISGAGTGESSWFMWARVKAEAERDLRELVGANSFRPAYIDSARMPGAVAWLEALKPVIATTSRWAGMYVRGVDVGRAMLKATLDGTRGATLENKAIVALARSADPAVVGD